MGTKDTSNVYVGDTGGPHEKHGSAKTTVGSSPGDERILPGGADRLADEGGAESTADDQSQKHSIGSENAQNNDTNKNSGNLSGVPPLNDVLVAPGGKVQSDANEGAAMMHRDGDNDQEGEKEEQVDEIRKNVLGSVNWNVEENTEQTLTEGGAQSDGHGIPTAGDSGNAGGNNCNEVVEEKKQKLGLKESNECQNGGTTKIVADDAAQQSQYVASGADRNGQMLSELPTEEMKWGSPGVKSGAGENPIVTKCQLYYKSDSDSTDSDDTDDVLRPYQKLAHEQPLGTDTQNNSKANNTHRSSSRDGNKRVPPSASSAQVKQHTGGNGGKLPQKPLKEELEQSNANSTQVPSTKSGRVMGLALVATLISAGFVCYSMAYMPDAEILLPGLNVSLEYSHLAAGITVCCVALAAWYCYSIGKRTNPSAGDSSLDEKDKARNVSASYRVMGLALGTALISSGFVCYSMAYMPDAEILLPGLNVSLESSDLAARLTVCCVVVALVALCCYSAEKRAVAPAPENSPAVFKDGHASTQMDRVKVNDGVDAAAEKMKV